MLLEKQLLVNTNAGLQPTPPKRARKAAKALPEDTVVWVELSKYEETLYFVLMQWTLC